MSYDGTIVRRAAGRLAAGKAQREGKVKALREQVYAQVPEVRQLDELLRRTVVFTIAAALRQGTDPTAAVEAQRAQNLSTQARRAELLRQNGFDPADLSETPDCPLCQDTGWLKGGMCGCLKALCAQEQVKELSKLLDLGGQRFEHFDLSYYPNVAGADGRPARKNMEQVLARCKAYALEFDSIRPKNLYLYGAPGLGKTFLSAAIARTVAEGGHSVVYDAAANIFAQFEVQKFSRDAGDSQDARDETRRYLNCDLLIVDDLGSEFPTQFVQASLYTLVNARLLSEKHTIISSNLSMPEAERRYPAPVISRIKGEYRSLPFVGEDIRLLKKDSQRGGGPGSGD